MKKKSVLLLLFLSMMTLLNVSAVTLHEYLPGGKNYLDPENFIQDGNTLHSINNIKVLPNTNYTLSFPSRELIGDNIFVLVEGESTYIDEYVFNVCIEESEFVVCSFTTTNTEENISIFIQSNQIDLYYQYYQMEDIQLEEGNNRSTFEQYIAPYVDSNSPEFQGSGAYIVSYDSDENIQAIISTHIKAYDEIDGDISHKIVIDSDMYTPNRNTVGEYLVELSVEDEALNKATFDLYIFVKDEIAPVIIGPNTIELNVDESLLVNEIIETYFTYYDDYDTTLHLNIKNDNYTSNESTLGTYSFSIEVVDQSQNSITESVSLEVLDVTAPTLISSNLINNNVNTPLQLIDIISSLNVTDNYDNDVSIEVLNDNYTSNESKVGTYFVDISLSDSSNNTTIETLQISVIDDEKPVISGSNTFSFSYTNTMSVQEILGYLSVSDNVDVLTTNDIFVIEDTYSLRESETGEYYMLFGLKDSSNNTSQYRVDISIYDDVSPYIFIDQYIIIVDVNSTFGVNDAMRFLTLNNVLDSDKSYQIEIINDEYKGNEENPGKYLYEVQFKDDDGIVITKEFMITVEENDSGFSYYRQVIIGVFSLIIIGSIFIYKKG